MEGLLAYLRDQGVNLDDALELAERKVKNPALVGVFFKGKWVRLTPISSERFDEMVQTGVPPGTSGTDRAFLEGTDNNRQFQRTPAIGEYYKREAKKRGHKFDRSQVYKASLARFPGDPRAFVSDLGQAKKVQELRREESLRNEGPTPEVDVADHIVDRETAVELAGQTVTGREVRDTREKVKNRLRPSWKKKK